MTDSATTQSGSTPSERTVIGISLGNCNSSIGVTIDDKAEVIANEDGDRQIPTIVSYVDGDEYYGGQAKSFLVRNPNNTVAYFKDFVGQEFKTVDPTHCHASAHPKDEGGVVSFTVQDKVAAEEDDEQPAPSTLSVSEVTTRYLRRLVTAASEYLGKKVTSAVIAVPTNFSDKQREALTKAANDAGIEILQLVAEPVAAILSYDARPEATVEDKIVVVADLGGTRSDVAVVASRSGIYTILATVHDYEFAGTHLDQVLIDHFAKEFQKKHNIDPREKARSLAKLKAEAESTKKTLSKSTSASFGVESLAEGLDFAASLNRTRYEMLARKVFEGFNRLIEGAIKKAGLDVLDIDEVILAGGTGNTPRIAANLATIFPESTTILSPSTVVDAINPSELAVRGAALQASLIQEFETEDIEQSTHPAVTTVKHIGNSIGVLTVGPAGEEVFTPIIMPDTAVPARRMIQFPVPKEGGDVLVKVVEGNTHIKVTQPEPKAKRATVEAAADSDDSDFDEEDEEDEEKREKEWKVGATLAEAALRDTKKDDKVEVTVNVLADLSVSVAIRVVGAKGGIRGTIQASA
ncbi:probable heat shock protein HSP70 (regulator protein involved in pleiotropic drug resistance) [Cephalotrichum gorgonifer]|uniref:Probable heat shock protein HSP70 (Regulator protein involved in pleiotropic drug resistance) n=1 Tax=Cephalotrichum gorgonifer TaxID=2041049 RepID=A0AAE8MUK3_9PEZI|nr:probable heat shock protein HSP70 (regulator protein involved in pleiotropic drug resistance) [Cephalotrichum gorgonifer]